MVAALRRLGGGGGPRAVALAVVVLIFEAPSGADGFCPKGFGNDMFFPPEWAIPKWPADMALDVASELKTVRLGGFTQSSLNEEYLQGPGKEFEMQGRETYWQASGQYFLYYCQRFGKWRIAQISGFGKNMNGECFAFVSDSYPGRDILNSSLIKNWIEVEAGKWEVREKAGVVALGKLGDQMGDDEAGDEEEEEDGDEGETTFEEGQCNGTDGDVDNSTCPVMPHVRRAKKKVVKAFKAAGNWARRLLPKMLGTPDEEDVIPVDAEEEAEELRAEANCDIRFADDCGFKSKFYIGKQEKATPDKRASELERLRRMLSVVMKPADKAWTRARVRILKQLVAKDEL